MKTRSLVSPTGDLPGSSPVRTVAILTNSFSFFKLISKFFFVFPSTIYAF
jgi:hypothetical protein